jgi:hypothetical protein
MVIILLNCQKITKLSVEAAMELFKGIIYLIYKIHLLMSILVAAIHVMRSGTLIGLEVGFWQIQKK